MPLDAKKHPPDGHDDEPIDSERSGVRASEPPEQDERISVIVADGDDLARGEDIDLAIGRYKRALLLMGWKKTPERGSVYEKIARAEETRGRPAVAANNYDKALSIDPLNRDALEAATRLLLGEKDFEGIDRLQKRRLEALASSADRLEVYQAMAMLWLDHAKDYEKGAAVLEAWIEEQPGDTDLLERLAAARDAQGEHAAAIETRRRLAEAYEGDPERQAAMFLLAATSAASLDDIRGAVELARRALRADATELAALELAARLLADRDSWSELADLYEDVVAWSNDPAVKLDLGKKLGTLCLDQLHDRRRALTALERAVVHDDDDAEIHRTLCDLHESAGSLDAAAEHCRAVLMCEPTNPEGYQRAYDLFVRGDAHDAAYNAAAVLDFLGEAGINESLLAETHRPEGLLPVTDGLDDDVWESGFLYAEREPNIGDLLELVTNAAIALKLEQLKKRKKLRELDASLQQDPETSTTMVAKSLLWTSRVLGVAPPKLFVLNKIPGHIAAAQLPDPTTLVDRTLASGVSLQELSFLWGRQLTFFRPEHVLLIFYPSAAELASLLMAALAVGGGAKEVGKLDADTKRFAKALAKRLTESEEKHLAKAVSRFPKTDKRAHMLAWARTVELAAGRAGLVACGSVATAAAMIRKFPPVGQLTEDEQIADLLCFAVSDEYAELRSRLGVTVSG